jgi:hypothetical protein
MGYPTHNTHTLIRNGVYNLVHHNFGKKMAWMRIEQRTIELLSPITQRPPGQPVPDGSDIRRISEPTGKIAIPRNDVDLFFCHRFEMWDTVDLFFIIDLKYGLPVGDRN